MTWKCTMCDREFETIPEDAVLISRRTRSRTFVYKFGGEIHSLRKIRPRLKSESVPPPPESPKGQMELLNSVVEVS